MADSTQAPPRPLNNRETVWKEIYLQAGRLYADGQPERKELLELAWELYQDPAIPILHRTFYCLVLATGDGDYLKFAQEGEDSAT